MKKYCYKFPQILLLILLFGNVSAQEISDSIKFNDGPYIFYEGTKLKSKTVVDGEVKTSKVSKNKYPTFFESDASQFTGIKKLAVLSDIHGQFELCLKLFKANGIIDENLKWNFGEGHLVICGDIFDRGLKVTEALWFIYELEQQAKAAGGKIHYLMGNHEYMALMGDLRYVHEDYMKVAELLGSPYDELYGEQTVLGRWLRSKSTVIKINDVVYLHGGISKAFLGKNLDLAEANEIYRESMGMRKPEVKASEKYGKYYDGDSPIWYRGYFSGDLSTDHIDSLLTKLDAKHIVIGHTSQKEVMKMYDGRIYVVDSSMKRGKNAEILIIEDGEFKRYSLEGTGLAFE